MTAVNRNQQEVIIDQLWRGESSQPEYRRVNGSVKTGFNMRFDVTEGGSVTRNATILTADLAAPQTTVQGLYKIHIRGTLIVIDESGNVQGWDEQGNELTVNGDTAAFAAYILESGQQLKLRLDHDVSYDTAVIVNRKVRPQTESSWTPQESFNYIVTGDKDDGTHGVTVTNQGAVDYFDEPASTDTATSLPTTPANGDYYKVRLDQELNPAGRYMYVNVAVTPEDATYPTGYFPLHGIWYRVPTPPRDSGQYSADSMPHRIVYNEEAGTLTVGPIPWKQRLNGNQYTNKAHPWAQINNGPRGIIKSVSFHDERLTLVGFSEATGQHVTSSREKDYYNLWTDNANVPTDSDPVIANIEETQFGEVLRAVSCGAALFITLEQGQGVFWADGAKLTNLNGHFEERTRFQSRDLMPGLGPGTVIIIDKQGDVHRFRWVNADSGGIVYDGFLTAHRRDLLDNVIPHAMFCIEETLFIALEDGPVLCHDSFGVGGELIQSAWGALEFGDPVVSMNPWDGAIQVVTHYFAGSGNPTPALSLLTYLHQHAAPPEGMLYVPHLDRMETVEPGDMSYDSMADRTTLMHTGRFGVLPVMEGDSDSPFLDTSLASCVIRRDSDSAHYVAFPIDLDESGHPVFEGDLTDADLYLGFAFDFYITLTRLYAGLTPRSVAMAHMTVFHDRSGIYYFEYTDLEGNVWRLESVEGGFIEAGEVETTTSIATGHAKFNVTLDAKTIDVHLKGRSPAPARFIGVHYVLNIGGSGDT